jgi:hypothetical protein
MQIAGSMSWQRVTDIPFLEPTIFRAPPTFLDNGRVQVCLEDRSDGSKNWSPVTSVTPVVSIKQP